MLCQYIGSHGYIASEQLLQLCKPRWGYWTQTANKHEHPVFAVLLMRIARD